MRFLTASSLAIAAIAFGLPAFASATPGDITPLPGIDGCVTENGSDPNGNANTCIDGKGLSGGLSALQVSPDGKRLFALGFDGFNQPVGDSITTYDRSSSIGSVTVDPRVNACRSAAPVIDCSTGGAQANNLQAPNGIAISPDSKQVYVSARRTNSVTVFDYVAVPQDGSGQQGPLAKKAAPNGCLTDAVQVGCTDARALSTATDVVISPDGDTVYTAGRQVSGGGVGVFDRDANGVLAQKVGPAACVNDLDLGNGCADGRFLEPQALAISADGKSLYAASLDPASSVTVFDISPDGTISQKVGVAGCFTESGSGGDCTAVPGLNVPVDISITPDGKSVYVTSDLEDFTDAPDVAPLIAFTRNTTDGSLTRQACFAADAALGCTDTAGIYRPISVTATDEAVYVGSQNRNADQISGEGATPGGLVILNRNQTTGVLNQPSGSAGCLTPTAFEDCGVSSTISRPRGIAVSPDGDSLYVGGGSGITVFDRDDGDAPVVSIDSGPTGDSTDTSATFTFSSNEPNTTFECRLNDDPFAPCTSPTSITSLPIRGNIYQVRGTDKFGRVSAAASRSFTATTLPPADTKVNAVITAAKVQKQKKGKLAVVVKIKANEDLKVSVSGSVKKGKAKVSFKGQTKALVAGTTSKITLKPAKAGQARLVAAALLGSKRTVPKIIITMTDGAQNKLVVKPKVTIQGYKAKQGKTGSAK